MNDRDDITREEFERIERYLLDAMGTEEEATFVKEMAADSKLSEKVAEIETILSGVSEAVFREQLNQFHQKWGSKFQKSTPRRKVLGWKTLGIAASFLLAFGFLGWYLLLRPDANELLFRTYFIVDPGLVTAMSTAAQYEFDRGMVDYKSGSYQAAIARWETLLRENPASDTLQYFLGASYLAIRAADPAISYLNLVARQEQSAFRQEASWYQGLAFLLAGNKQDALRMLRDSEHPKASELVDKLSNE